jgi:hypothetical protein
MDTARVNTFGSLVAVPFMSKRFAMKRFLGLTTEEITENEQMWREENVDTDVSLSASAELRSQGVTANNITGDLSALSNATSASLPGGDSTVGDTAPGGDMGDAAPGSPQV